MTISTPPLYASYEDSGAWDLSKIDNLEYPILNFTGSVESINFKPDGLTLLLVLGGTNHRALQFTLTEPWDLKTINPIPTASFSLPTSGLCWGSNFSADGTKLYTVTGTNPRNLTEYTLGTPWQVSTITLTNQLVGVFGSDFFIIYTVVGDNLFEARGYDLRHYIFTTPGDITSLTLNAHLVDPRSSHRGIFVNQDLTKICFRGIDSLESYNLSIQGNSIHLDSISTKTVLLRSPGSNKFSIKEDGLTGFFYSEGRIFDLKTVIPFDFTEAQSLRSELVFTGQFRFSSDGTKLFKSATGGRRRLEQYDLPKAWDLPSTLPTKSADIINPHTDTAYIAFEFSSDGLKVYVLATSFNTLYQYDLVTPWDISEYNPIINYRKLSGIDRNHRDFTFSHDGYKLFILSLDNLPYFQTFSYTQYKSFMYTFELSTPYEISTAVLSQINQTVDNARSIHFRPDGRLLFVSDNILKSFDLSVPWDMSTATPTGESFEGSSNIFEVFIKPSGRDYFITLNSGKLVHYKTIVEGAYD